MPEHIERFTYVDTPDHNPIYVDVDDPNLDHILCNGDRPVVVLSTNEALMRPVLSDPPIRLVDHHVRGPLIETNEIGRASCRERV